MKKIIASLVLVSGTTASLFIGTNSVLAASFNWSYTTQGGDLYTGMLDGEVQVDDNTINVSSVFMSQLNGFDLPDTPIIRDSEAVLNSTGIVSFDGSTMNLGACTDTACNDGMFIGNLGLGGSNFFSTSVNFGDDFEDFEVSRWTLIEKPSVPEPSLTFALVGLGVSTLVKSSLKKH